MLRRSAWGVVMVVWQVILESLLAVGFMAFGVYKGIQANKREQYGKGFIWFAVLPLLGLIGFFSFVLFVLLACVGIVLFVLAVLSGSFNHGMIRHSVNRAEFRSDVQTGVSKALDGTGPTTIHVKSAWTADGGWVEKEERRSDVETAANKAAVDWRNRHG